MHKTIKIFIVSILSVMSISIIEANPSFAAEGIYQNYSEDTDDQGNDAFQSNPDISGEREFMTQSRNRMNQLQQSNRNMIEQDRRMMREGYDANQSYDRKNFNRPQQDELNHH